ncbi:CNNM domain-containing protein [Mobilicoccus pelagius]|uniref:Uncharacterized protein n=1 Tax=Mobilicoccus pelagius NBRC 104925 TaxID=1089455 RepID=H5UNL3_9MICO|nr:hemolysin family protein [Mobilicoccus pelagius]GAB47321.1 hypothetical protein MOPEL_009_00110 [Mobilicoccus pelagius NBRC 104925]
MSGLTVVLVTVVLIVASAFFVAIEFSLMAAKRHRLEGLATTSRAARAALRNSSELTLLLAGSQLGITLCTLALGAVTKPAVHHALTPLLEVAGMPRSVADVAAFVLALLIVTFLHLVVGEMAPKSWAIAHPERSAVLLSLPMRGFMFLVRPVLRALNHSANALVRRLGATPVDELASGQDPAGLRQLVEHSANVGALDAAFRSSIERALDLRELTVADLVRPTASMTSVPAGATMAAVQDATRRTGHLRVLLRERGRMVGVVHVRDTLEADPRAKADTVAQPVFELEAGMPLYEAMALMREQRKQLAVVRQGARQIGVVTLSDILPGLLPPATENGAAKGSEGRTGSTAGTV